jgi:hypothetical protein
MIAAACRTWAKENGSVKVIATPECKWSSGNCVYPSLRRAEVEVGALESVNGGQSCRATNLGAFSRGLTGGQKSCVELSWCHAVRMTMQSVGVLGVSTAIRWTPVVACNWQEASPLWRGSTLHIQSEPAAISMPVAVLGFCFLFRRAVGTSGRI